MSRGYQNTDAEIVDYEIFELPRVPYGFRGPAPGPGDYLAFLGAAQTFGRFVQTPFPQLVSRALGKNALNLGHGGAGPEFYLNNPRLLEHINRARVVVVQVLSGRSQSNSLFSLTDNRTSGTNLMTGSSQTADEFYTWLLNQDLELVKKTVAETRENYVEANRRLLDSIKPPKILFWFSNRAPAYQQRWELPLGRLWGEFPQFVNQEMIDLLRHRADVRYVECISRRGIPHQLFDGSGKPASFERTGGGRSTENLYYPSPEMHEDAAALLIPACLEILRQTANAQ